MRRALLLSLLCFAVAAPAEAALGPVPAGWPGGLQIGVADAPGGAASWRGVVGLRYQYLAGGVNTGSGWATWNEPAGAFAALYVAESADAGILPVFTYYQLLHSAPPAGGDEGEQDRAKLAGAATMRDYYADFRLLMQRAAGPRPVIVHVEPDLWAYIQLAASGDNAATVPASVGGSGDAELAGLPDNAAGFAQALVRLRDRYAPNVRLAFHLSSWATGTDIAINDPSEGEVDAMAARLSAFYRSLGAAFDLTFADQADRDAGSTGSWWDAAAYERGARLLGGFAEATGQRIVLWQLPLGNSTLPAGDRDNHVEWFLDDPPRAHLQRYADAGVIALLFGAGAESETDASEDGGLFRARAAAYLAAGPLALPGGSTAPPGGGGPGPGPGGGAGTRITARLVRLPRAVRRGHRLRVRVRLAGPVPARGRLRVTLRRRSVAITRRVRLRGPGTYRVALRIPRGVARGRWQLVARCSGVTAPLAVARVRVR
jgi:hypothetical protein